MPRENRASQFAPFDALKGLSESIGFAQYRHNKSVMKEMPQDKIEEISKTLSQITKDDEIFVKYFFDGYEIECTGNAKIDAVFQQVKIMDKVIKFDQIIDIKIL